MNPELWPFGLGLGVGSFTAGPPAEFFGPGGFEDALLLEDDLSSLLLESGDDILLEVTV